MVYKKQMDKFEKINLEIKTGKEKIQALDHIISLNEKIKKFKEKSWTTLDATEIMGKIFDVGLESQLKIRDISPDARKDEKNYVLLPFTLSCEATYKALYKFIKRLETYPMWWRIRTVTCGPLRSDGTFENNVALKINIGIDAIYLK
jgi:Tfp pilus assembly protein PilO